MKIFTYNWIWIDFFTECVCLYVQFGIILNLEYLDWNDNSHVKFLIIYIIIISFSENYLYKIYEIHERMKDEFIVITSLSINKLFK